ncbi:hypothetical protein VJ737_16550 [Streptomyces violarus]|nr:MULTISPECIES: hypothetical protein [Streptomyces]WRT99203.1 hypothetical protein VJ737_16550 [Streptomyces sp. CGMCC 4.1772]
MDKDPTPGDPQRVRTLAKQLHDFADVPKNLKKSYEMCGDALSDFWPKLERAQSLADKALRLLGTPGAPDGARLVERRVLPHQRL